MAGNILLLLTALGSAIVMFRQTETTGPERRLLLQVSSLGLLFIAVAALGRLTLLSSSQDIATLQRMLDNLALYAALPLLASVILAQAWHWHWSRAGWGRWLLGLFALFELCRRMDMGEQYTLVMGAAVGLTLLLAASRLHGVYARLAAIGSGLLIAVSICTPLLTSLTLPALTLATAHASALLLFAVALISQPESLPQ